jgi:general secretion pathway protein D
MDLCVKSFLSAVLKICIMIMLANSFWVSAYAQNQPPDADQNLFEPDFKDVDIQEMIKLVADITGKTLVIDPRVQGRINVISSKKLSASELYNLFLSVLEVQGFTAIEFGDVVRILPRQDARTSAVPVNNFGKLGDDTYITQVIQLDNVSAAKVLPVLRPLAPQHAHLAAYAPSNAIIISDTVANIARLKDIIRSIDLAGEAETSIVKLKYAQAETMVTLLQSLQRAEEKDDPANAKSSIVADNRTNSILVTADDVRQKKILNLIQSLDTPREQSGNVRVIYLEYADAEKVAEVLSKVVSGISKLTSINSASSGGQPGASATTVEADPSTNALLITADTETLETLLPVIDRLDIRRSQVLVEAIIVEVRGDLNKQLGVEWAAFKENRIVAGLTNSGNLAGVASAIQAGTNPIIPSGLLLSFGIDNIESSGTNFAGLVQFLESNSEANILSTPSILTTDNNAASISVAENVPFITGTFTNDSGSTNPFQTIERRDVGITLKVTPQISKGETLVLEIDQQVSNVSSQAISGASDIVTTVRQITTQVIAQNGEVIILGGLIEDQVTQTQQKIPLLGDIPYLGRLFRNDITDVQKSNLMIFLKSTIIRSPQELRGATAEKYNNIRTNQLESIKKGVPLVPDDVIPLLPVWDDVISAADAALSSQSAK